MLIQRYLYTIYYRDYTCLEVPVGTAKILRNIYWYCRTYPYTGVPVSTTKLILVLRILYLYYEAYPGLTELILVLLNLFLHFRSYTCIKGLILVLRNLYLYYRAYSYFSDHIQSLFWYKSTRRYYTDSLYGSTRRYYWTYTYIIGLILILQIREYP